MATAVMGAFAGDNISGEQRLHDGQPTSITGTCKKGEEGGHRCY